MRKANKRNEFSIVITKNIKLTTEDIDDIMVSALEGGITYWCGRAEVVGKYLGEYASEQIARGGSLILHDAENGDADELTLQKFLKGVQMAINQNYYSDYGWFTGDSIDTCQVDAEVADCIIQLALFDDVIYG
jgi:hypothetical protein